MATRDVTERAPVSVGGESRSARRLEKTKWAFLTTEFWAMLGVIVATLVAAQVADNFDAPRAWLIVGFVAASYIVSRGLAKAGNAHRDYGGSRDN